MTDLLVADCVARSFEGRRILSSATLRAVPALCELADEGVAVVVTGHEVPTLLDAAQHVTWCTSGTTYELGPPDVARRHEGFRDDYLGGWSD